MIDIKNKHEIVDFPDLGAVSQSNSRKTRKENHVEIKNRTFKERKKKAKKKPEYKVTSLEELNSIIHRGSKLKPDFAHRFRYEQEHDSVSDRENKLNNLCQQK